MSYTLPCAHALARPLLGLLALLALAGPRLEAQVAIAPTAVFLDDRTPFGTLLIANRSGEPQEVAIEFRFGYPVSDSLGRIAMAYGDSLPAAAWSVRPWVRAFPRRFVLEPGEDQMVRIVARVPPGLPEGVYWTRIVTSSVGRAPVLAAGDGGNGPSARVDVRLEQVTTLLYRHGRVGTAVSIGDPVVTTDSAGVHFLVPLARGGNAPFLGTLAVRVIDAAGASVAHAEETIALYVPMTRRLRVARLPRGRYTAEIVVETRRGDLPREELFEIRPVTRRVPFTVP